MPGSPNCELPGLGCFLSLGTRVNPSPVVDTKLLKLIDGFQITVALTSHTLRPANVSTADQTGSGVWTQAAPMRRPGGRVVVGGGRAPGDSCHFCRHSANFTPPPVTEWYQLFCCRAGTQQIRSDH